MLGSRYLCYLVAAVVSVNLIFSPVDAAVPTMIWLSPRNVSYANFVSEDFSAARGVWADVATGAGSRTDSPVVHLDSKGLLWIYGGNPSFFIRLTSDSPKHNYTALNTVWTYDMVQDKYRWVAGTSDYDGQYSNFGQMGVPSDDVFPGLKGRSAHAIDKNDNIWIYGGLYGNDDEKQSDNTMWLFNTTSLQFTWIGGDSSNTKSVFGNLGKASAEYWPGLLNGARMVADSNNNLWMFGGLNYGFIINGVWLFNTTSRMWSLQWGDPKSNYTALDYERQIWPGRWSTGYTIDEEDRVWLFGGLGSEVVGYSFWADMWSFDTKTVTWRVERAIDKTLPDGNVTSYDTFDINNYPPRRDMVSMVDRRDGTIMVHGGRSPYDTAYHDIWVFNKTSKQWKIVYGGPPYNGSVHHLYGEYRGAGSLLGTRRAHSAESGLNAKGHMIIMGGDNYMSTAFNDVWIIPQDQCLTNLHDCDPNASCVTLEWDRAVQCKCNQGYFGDGKTCTASPSIAQPTSPDAKVSSGVIDRGLEILLIVALSFALMMC